MIFHENVSFTKTAAGHPGPSVPSPGHPPKSLKTLKTMRKQQNQIFYNVLVFCFFGVHEPRPWAPCLKFPFGGGGLWALSHGTL